MRDTPLTSYVTLGIFGHQVRLWLLHPGERTGNMEQALSFPLGKGRLQLELQEDFPESKGTMGKMVNTERRPPGAGPWELGVGHRLS